MSIVSICGSKKRDSTLEEHYRGYGFHDWLQSLNFIVIGRDPWNKRGVNYLSCLEEKEGLKDTVLQKNAALFVDLLLDIFWF